MDVLMVCLGNICRSPLAEGILRQKVEELGLEWSIDSAGTGAWHVGEKPDVRSIRVAEEYSIDITELRARQFSSADFDRFDWIIAMDESNFDFIQRKESEQSRAKVTLMLEFLHPGQNKSIPDPYFGGEPGFYNIFNLLDKACDAMIKSIQKDALPVR